MQKCGLLVHKIYPYLAALPDECVGREGIVEFKWPYKIKDQLDLKPLTYLDLG